MMRKKDNLIPLEKSKKIIHLDKRGPGERKKYFGTVIFGIMGILCLGYCLAIGLFMGYGTRFFMIWGLAAVFCGVLAFLLCHPRILARIPKIIRHGFVILGTLGLLIFCLIEGFILSRFSEVPAAGADYVIVLGAQWKKSGPSYTLQKRLDAAEKYLKENQDTLVIVSGGQGSNEVISEAQGMKEYLMNAGIAEERIFMEDTSTNTNENLVNSSRLLDKENDRVVLVTNDFHMFRASSIARHKGYMHVEGLSAGSYPGMLPNNLLREFFGVLKDSLVGNM